MVESHSEHILHGDADGPATGTSAVCPYCGVGCVLNATVEGNRVTRVMPAKNGAPNRGMMCPKGALVHRVFIDQARLTEPVYRTAKSEERKPVGWDAALDLVAARIESAQKNKGPRSVAWYGSGQLDTEASYCFTKLFKGVIGSNETETNSRLCMSSAAAGYVASLGSDGPPTCYEDIDHADTFFVLGANMSSNHPVLFNMLRRRRTENPDARIIVVDPRATKTARFADLHVPVRPGGDIPLLRLIAIELIEMGACDKLFVSESTSGYNDWAEALLAMDKAQLHKDCGIGPDIIKEIATCWSGRRRVLSFYCMGANQSSCGTQNNTAIIDLHLLTGNIGREGCGPFSLTGQPNAMGGREVGYMSHQLPGYRMATDAQHREQVERAWGLASGSIADTPGRSSVDLFKAGAAGELEVLWIVCTNPVVSIPDASVVKAALERTPLVIVQDAYKDTETTAYADLLLPAAQWGEKSGTMTNSERLVVRSRKFLDAPGAAQPDWWPAAEVMSRLAPELSRFKTAEDAWDEFRLLTKGRPCDMTGLTNERLNTGPAHWPCTEQRGASSKRRYTDGVFHTRDGLARFTSISRYGPSEATSEEYPFVLTTGRVAQHWHTMTKTRHVPELMAQQSEPFIEINTADALELGVVQGEVITLRSKRGEASARARVGEDVPRGTVFMPFHWGDLHGPGSTVNNVTNPVYDPVSKQPEFKFCAVQVCVAEQQHVADEVGS